MIRGTDMIGPVKLSRLVFFIRSFLSCWVMEGQGNEGWSVLATADQTDIRGLVTA